MATKKVNWIRDWLVQDYTGFDKKQITDAKKEFKEKARKKIDGKIISLNKNGAKISKKYVLRWQQERGVPKYFLVCYIKPAPVLIPKKAGIPTGGGGESTVSPTRPPSP